MDISTRHLTQMFQKVSMLQIFMNIGTDYRRTALREIPPLSNHANNLINGNMSSEPPFQEDAEVAFQQVLDLFIEKAFPLHPIVVEEDDHGGEAAAQ
jgi:hypothetical protein